MESAKSPLSAVKAEENLPPTSEQKIVPGVDSLEQKAAAAPAAPKKPAPKIPEGYKVVKVNRNGKIVKVLRPIEKDNAAAPSPSTAPSKPAEMPAKLDTAIAAVINSTTKVAPQAATEDQTTAPEKGQPSASTTGKPTTAALPATTAKKPGTVSKKAEAAPAKPTTTTPTQTSKLETVGKSARITRRFHRVGRHASNIIGAFDPYSDIGDYEDGGDYESGDISMSDDSHNGRDSDSDDSDRERNQQRNTQSESTAAAKAAAANVGRQPVKNNTAAVPKAAQTGILSQNAARNKSTSTELTKDAMVLEKEVLPGTNTEDGTIQPVGPRSLRQEYSANWEKLVVWSLVILFPLAFIGLGIATACLKNRPTTTVKYSISDTYDYVMTNEETYMSKTIRHATKAAITAWPIVFAAILAQTLKAFATYRVERGIRLLTLEQLISSHSVSSAIKQPFALRSFNWMSIGLLAIWGLSPLGSQAIQYTTYAIDHKYHENRTIYYLNTAQTNPGLSTQYEADHNYSSSMDILYAAVFQQSTQFQPFGSDPWGNALIPVVEYLDNTGRENIDSFHTSWSSYYGIPLDGTADYYGEYDGTWTFTINSSYLHLDCPSLDFVTAGAFDGLGIDPEIMFNTSTGSLNMDMTPPTPEDPVGNVTFLSACSSFRPENGSQTYAYAFCNMTQTFVESSISCHSTNCTANNATKLTGWKPTQMTYWIENFLKASDVGQDTYSFVQGSDYSITELWIRNSTNATTPGAGNTCDLGHTEPRTFESRLAFLMNSYYSTGFTHDFQVGSIHNTTNVTFSNDTIETEKTIALMAGTMGDRTWQDPFAPQIWQISWRFMVIYLFCVLAMLLIGILGILLELKTISPDILGFASSLARNSKYIKVDKTKVTGAMGGGERIRALGDTRVVMQDIRPDQTVGKIVLGTVSEGTVRLRPGKLYC